MSYRYHNEIFQLENVTDNKLLTRILRKLLVQLTGGTSNTGNRMIEAASLILSKIESFKPGNDIDTAVRLALRSFYEDFYNENNLSNDFCDSYRYHLGKTYSRRDRVETFTKIIGVGILIIRDNELIGIEPNVIGIQDAMRIAPHEHTNIRKFAMKLFKVHKELEQGCQLMEERRRRREAANKIKRWWTEMFWSPYTRLGQKRLMRSFENEEYSVW